MGWLRETKVFLHLPLLFSAVNPKPSREQHPTPRYELSRSVRYTRAARAVRIRQTPAASSGGTCQGASKPHGAHWRWRGLSFPQKQHRFNDQGLGSKSFTLNSHFFACLDSPLSALPHTTYVIGPTSAAVKADEQRSASAAELYNPSHLGLNGL